MKILAFDSTARAASVAVLEDERALAIFTIDNGLTQSELLLPMAEDEWDTRPDTVSYGTVRYDFEADALRGDDIKTATAYEGSVDLYSLMRSGAGWIPLIKEALTKHCGGSWSLNHHTYERDTGLFHWEWAFQVGE